MRRWVLLSIFLVASCSRSIDFKPIQQQKSGNYTITLLNDTGVMKQHSDHLRVEFRNTSTNELVDVNNLKIQATMIMPGMGPMFGNLSAPKQAAPGQYDLDADFSMAGQWNVVVTFDPDGRVQFTPRAQ